LPIEGPVALLKVGHHGSGSSSGSSFLRRVRPRWAVISCGRRNPFGHPDPGALERLGAVGATIVRTDRSGALWFEADSSGVRLLDWRRGTPWRPVPVRTASRGRGQESCTPIEVKRE